jgi:hypothetical protein
MLGPAIAPVLAHFGHWYFQLLYAVPVAVIVGVLTIQSWRDGRARRARERARSGSAADTHPSGPRGG